jgi:8-oxo-dGTP diphosphatase
MKESVVRLQQVPRSEVEKHPALHLQIIIAVVVNKSGEVLVHQRSLNKKVDPGYIDLVCGAVVSGETSIEAAIRESKEETGVNIQDVKIIAQGINSYNRFRSLLLAVTGDLPVLNNQDAEWVEFIAPEKLDEMKKSGKVKFVDEFFEDINLVLDRKNNFDKTHK